MSKIFTIHKIELTRKFVKLFFSKENLWDEIIKYIKFTELLEKDETLFSYVSKNGMQGIKVYYENGEIAKFSIN